ncbi:MAG: NifU family protein [Candidatus Eremiobacteraeota bacterium]|nr:NifU family protein [Candidatus Eremiobacteraeota bacterium]
METTADLAQRIEHALERVRPAILADGGDVWFIKAQDGIAYVQMLGACGSCAMSTATLKDAIERAILEECPEVCAVEQI